MKEEDMVDMEPLTDEDIALLNRRARAARAIEEADWLLDADSFDAEQLRMLTLTEVREAE